MPHSQQYVMNEVNDIQEKQRSSVTCNFECILIQVAIIQSVASRFG